MPIGEYTINVPTGTHKVSASKSKYNPQSINDIEVSEDQTTVLNFKLIGGDNMEHITDIIITSCEEEIINAPDGCATKSYKYIGAISGNPLVGETIELRTTDGTTVLQTEITDANGVVTFTNILFGNYKLRKV